MYQTTQAGSTNFAFPDVCLTPTPVGPIPIPYPNTADTSTAVPPALIVLVECMPAHNITSIVPMSNGDNAGVNMGVASGTVMGPCFTILGSFTLMSGGLPAVRQTSMTLQNTFNMVGSTTSPSQQTLDVQA